MNHRTFLLEDQKAFAAVSGDANPIHVDPLAARRLLFGGTVVHGVHLALWGLDQWLAATDQGLHLRRVKATFQEPVRVGEKVTWSAERDGDNVTLKVGAGVGHGTTIHVETVPGPPQPAAADYGTVPLPAALCRDRSDDEVAVGIGGDFALGLEAALAARLFPKLSRRVPPAELAALLALTRLVGMECPGCHSIFSDFDVEFADATKNPPPDPRLEYIIRAFDPRFQWITMGVQAPGLSGTVRAFRRPQPRGQADFATLRERVKPGEFADWRALVIGGSRGLGEVAVKLLAAGGAEVRFTYHSGRDDAERIIEDLRGGGGAAQAFALNVLDPDLQALSELAQQWGPTHVAYFATPAIAVAQKGRFSLDLFMSFCDFYLRGLAAVLSPLESAHLRAVMAPSSIAVEEVPLAMGEYAAAKAAGEVLATFLAKRRHDLVVRSPRFPRLATDQTSALLSVEAPDPTDAVLEALRDLTPRSA